MLLKPATAPAATLGKTAVNSKASRINDCDVNNFLFFVVTLNVKKGLKRNLSVGIYG